MEQIIYLVAIILVYVLITLSVLMLSLNRFKNPVYVVLFTLLYPLLMGIVHVIGSFIVLFIGDLGLIQNFLFGFLIAAPFYLEYWKLYYSFPNN